MSKYEITLRLKNELTAEQQTAFCDKLKFSLKKSKVKGKFLILTGKSKLEIDDDWIDKAIRAADAKKDISDVQFASE